MNAHLWRIVLICGTTGGVLGALAVLIAEAIFR